MIPCFVIMIDTLSTEVEPAITRERYLVEVDQVVVAPPDATYRNHLPPVALSAILPVKEEWRRRADCRGYPGLMDDQKSGEYKAEYIKREILAKQMCGSCAVRQ